MTDPPTASRLARTIREAILTAPLRMAAGPLPASDDPSGVWHGDPERPVRCLAVAVAPTPGDAERARAGGADALLAHRPWGLDPPPDGLSVLAFHRALDDVLTTGFNPTLARLWGLAGVQPLGVARRLGALGMVGTLPRADPAWPRLVRDTFGGVEAHVPGLVWAPRRVAVVAALRPDLLERAAARGADAYVTGQMRPAAARAALRSGLHVTAVGHARSEAWAMRQLAGAVQAQFSGLRVISCEATS